jgi:hypothetical protein
MFWDNWALFVFQLSPYPFAEPLPAVHLCVCPASGQSLTARQRCPLGPDKIGQNRLSPLIESQPSTLSCSN